MQTMQTAAPRRHASHATFRRRRAVALLTLVVSLVGLFTLLAPNSGAAPAYDEPSVLVVMGPGDTLAEILRPFVPEGKDPRSFAAEVLQANGLDGRAVRPGAVLRLSRP